MVTIDVQVESDDDPCPRAVVTVTGLTGDTVTLTRHYGPTTGDVRGMYRRPTTGSTFITDFEVPLQTPFTYTASSYNTSGGLVDFATSAVVNVPPSLYDGEMAWVQDPLSPTTAMRVLLESRSATGMEYARDAFFARPIDGDAIGIGGNMGDAQNVPFNVFTRYGDETAKFLDMARTAFPLLIRSVAPITLPPLTYAGIPGIRRSQIDLDRAGWEAWEASFTIVRAPSAAIVKPIYTYADVMEMYAGWTFQQVMDANPGTFLDFIKDPKRGLNA